MMMPARKKKRVTMMVMMEKQKPKVMMTVTTVTKCAKEKKSIMRDANANVNPLDRPAMPSSPVYQDWQQSWLSHHSLSNLDLRGDISCDFESIPVSKVKQMKRAS